MDNTISKTNIKGEVITNLKDDQFLYFADKSCLGIILIQRGILKYFNRKFAEIFGYTEDEISNWDKREFYKIVHPEDLSKLTQNFKIEDNRTASVQFRGIRKDGQIIPIENYVCTVKYNGINGYLSTYNLLDKSTKYDKKSSIINKKILLVFEIPQNKKEALTKIVEHLKIEGIKIKKLIELIN